MLFKRAGVSSRGAAHDSCTFLAMCGIVGYSGHRQAERVIIDGLRRLEYRGYDSAGLAVVADGNL
ncbi:glutamine--fructose-6-phosphate aminotransferase, partial [Xanthomonas citri pv. citri]|nr:glutamine--fructose-6-phosphate aminotransferase [Xanthomonas citri pv. citri]